MKIDAFADHLLEILACPISVGHLRRNGDVLFSDTGFAYPGGDFRIWTMTQSTKKWADGQDNYVKYNCEWMSNSNGFFDEVDKEAVQVFTKYPLTGLVLDVGGGYGTAAQQAGISANRYICFDPMICLWKELPSDVAFTTHYQSISNHPRVPAFAEYLPVRNNIADTVLMRSCLDHFMDPHRALLEARRALKPNGQLVVALSLEGAYKKDRNNLYNKIKGKIKTSFIGAIYEHFFDPHMFHPTSRAFALGCH